MEVLNLKSSLLFEWIFGVLVTIFSIVDHLLVPALKFNFPELPVSLSVVLSLVWF